MIFSFARFFAGKFGLATALTAIVAAGVPALPANADTNLVAFPSGYGDTFVRYTTVDKPHPERGPSVRDIFIGREALAAVKAGRPLPSGTVIVMEVHRARQDAAKTPLPGADGRFAKEALSMVFVMEKRTGWGADYPAALRNGEWEYARFNADGTRHESLDMKSCFGCHKSLAAADFVFTMDALKGFAPR